MLELKVQNECSMIESSLESTYFIQDSYEAKYIIECVRQTRRKTKKNYLEKRAWTKRG